jgi:hypothetical protein
VIGDPRPLMPTNWPYGVCYCDGERLGEGRRHAPGSSVCMFRNPDHPRSGPDWRGEPLEWEGSYVRLGPQE